MLMFATNRFFFLLSLILIPEIPSLISQLPNKFKISLKAKQITFTLVFAYLSVIAFNQLRTTKLALSNTDVLASYTKGLADISPQAIQYMKDYPLPDNLFNNINWGGFLAWQFPDLKYMADGKMDNYFINGESFLLEYIDIIQAKPGWEEKLNHYKINSVVLVNQDVLLEKLKSSSQWKQVYADDIATILVRKN